MGLVSKHLYPNDLEARLQFGKQDAFSPVGHALSGPQRGLKE